MGQVQVRTATRVKEDGAVLSSSFHRHVLVPRNKVGDTWEDTDISSEDAKVQANRIKPEDRPCQGGFPATGLAHKPKPLTAAQGKADAAHGRF